MLNISDTHIKYNWRFVTIIQAFALYNHNTVKWAQTLFYFKVLFVPAALSLLEKFEKQS